jgi:hypothetical protein
MRRGDVLAAVGKMINRTVRPAKSQDNLARKLKVGFLNMKGLKGKLNNKDFWI